MEKIEIIKKLKQYNKWRRGDENIDMPDTKEIGLTIDEAIKNLELSEFDRKIQDFDLYDNMQYYMEYCLKKEYVTPKFWLENIKNF